MKKLILTFLFLIILASTASGIGGLLERGKLKVEAIPRTVIVGEEVEIIVTRLVTNAPVPDAEVRVAKVREIKDIVIQ